MEKKKKMSLKIKYLILCSNSDVIALNHSFRIVNFPVIRLFVRRKLNRKKTLLANIRHHFKRKPN